MRAMAPCSPLRRLAATLALTGWVGFAGGGEAAELLAQAFGSHGDCRMACCREQVNASCPRMSGAAVVANGDSHQHSGHEAARSDSPFPAPALAISAISSCEENCALLLGLNRSALAPQRSPAPAAPDVPAVPSVRATDLPSARFLSTVPSRAPPPA